MYIKPGPIWEQGECTSGRQIGEFLAERVVIFTRWSQNVTEVGGEEYKRYCLGAPAFYSTHFDRRTLHMTHRHSLKTVLSSNVVNVRW